MPGRVRVEHEFTVATLAQSHYRYCCQLSSTYAMLLYM
jgi:hypothetical protein